MKTNLTLFQYTVDEYMRFMKELSVVKPNSITDGYSEADYIGIQVRLMLLRKYFSGGKNPENVNIKKVIETAQQLLPSAHDKLKEILDDFELIEKQQLEHLLSDGSKLNLYTTVEDTVYGLYLHADQNRIQRLSCTNEQIRFVCIRKFVLEIEEVVLRLYTLLNECGITSEIHFANIRSPMLYFGDTTSNEQGVTGSSYWSNVYGKDATDADLKEIIDAISPEEKEILLLCTSFAEELKSSPLQIKKLRKYIHPAVKSDWGDFTQAQSFFLSIPNPGYSTKVRYNESKDTAYVRFFPHVDDAFQIDTPHIFSNVYEFALGKWLGKWRIYSFGGHLDSIYESKK